MTLQRFDLLPKNVVSINWQKALLIPAHIERSCGLAKYVCASLFFDNEDNSRFAVQFHREMQPGTVKLHFCRTLLLNVGRFLNHCGIGIGRYYVEWNAETSMLVCSKVS